MSHFIVCSHNKCFAVWYRRSVRFVQLSCNVNTSNISVYFLQCNTNRTVTFCTYTCIFITINYLRQAGYVMSAVCLFICLFVCLSVCLRTTEQLFMKILSQMHLWTRKNLLNCGILSASGFGSGNFKKDSSTLHDGAFFTISLISLEKMAGSS